MRSHGCLSQSLKSYVSDSTGDSIQIQRAVQYANFLLLDSMIWRYKKYLDNLVFSSGAVSYGCLFLSSVCLFRSGDFTPEKKVAVTNSFPGQLGHCKRCTPVELEEITINAAILQWKKGSHFQYSRMNSVI